MKRLTAFLLAAALLVITVNGLPKNYIPVLSSSFTGATIQNSDWQSYGCGHTFVTENNNKFLRGLSVDQSWLKKEYSPILNIAPYLPNGGSNATVSFSFSMRLVSYGQLQTKAAVSVGLRLCTKEFPENNLTVLWSSNAVAYDGWFQVKTNKVSFSAGSDKEFTSAYFVISSIIPDGGAKEDGSIPQVRYIDLDDFVMYVYDGDKPVDDGITPSPSPKRTAAPPTASPVPTEPDSTATIVSETPTETPSQTVEPIITQEPPTTTPLPPESDTGWYLLVAAIAGVCALIIASIIFTTIRQKKKNSSCSDEEKGV